MSEGAIRLVGALPLDENDDLAIQRPRNPEKAPPNQRPRA
jgi:hypothetical protein